MSQNTDLKQMERKAWTSYFQDGMWDIFMGLLMLAMGVHLLTDNGPIHYALMAIAVLALILVRRYITVPRLGRARFGPMRKVKNRAVIVVLAISVLAGVGGFIASAAGAGPPPESFAALIPFFTLLTFGLMAFFMDFPRLYAYGFLFALSISLAIAFKDDTAATVLFLVSGGLGLLVGVTMLARFIRRYPRLTGDSGHA
jgi:hypothetical protein